LRRYSSFMPGLGEEQLFLLLAIVIGAWSGLLVVWFRVAIEWCRIALLGSATVPSFPRVLLVPAVVGLVVAALVTRLFPRVRGSGVNQTKSAVYIFNGHIPFSTVIGKFITSALAIGSGQSLGPEDPSLQIGAGVASAVGRRLGLSRDRLRLVAPVGAAAGLAAAFNSPITAVLFVIEEVIGRWTAGVLGAVVLAAVSSVVVAQVFLGSQPLFRVPPYHLEHASALLVYAALGAVGGLVSVLFVKAIARIRPPLKRLPRWTQYLQPAAAGLLIGVIGLWVPQVMGAGYEVIDRTMRDQYVWHMLAVLGALKLVATTISFVSGTPGGLFAPTLFIGATFGGAVGALARLLFPSLDATPGTYALVGMGTLFAGFLRAPMTSVFMMVEISGNYTIILPVMISNTIAYLISRRLQATALFDLLGRQDGTELPSMEQEREERVIRVEDAVRAMTWPIIEADEAVGKARDLAREAGVSQLLVRERGGWWVEGAYD
jgi:CIC family chloride channel protein